MLQGGLAEVLQPLTQAAQQAALSFATSPSTSASMAMLQSLSVPVARLQVLMSGLAATHAHALLHRAPEVAAFASSMKVSLTLVSVAAASFVLRLQKQHVEPAKGHLFPSVHRRTNVLQQMALEIVVCASAADSIACTKLTSCTGDDDRSLGGIAHMSGLQSSI